MTPRIWIAHDTVYIQWGRCGPFIAVTPDDADRRERFTLPRAAKPACPPGEPGEPCTCLDDVA